MTSTAIVREVLDGDVEAFRTLVDQHKSKLLGVLVRILRDHSVAEEVAHDTFVKAYTRLAGYRAEASFSTWLIQIGIHLARDRQRDQARLNRRGVVSLDVLRLQEQGAWEPADRRAVADPQVDLENREQWACFQRAMNEIPADFREVFTLRHLEDLDYREIAEMTGDSPGTLKVRAHRARRLLKDKMEAMGVELGATKTARRQRLARGQEGT